MPSSHNRNPTGKNGKNTISKDDPRLQAALLSYHKQAITNNDEISDLLLKEHEIVLCARTVKTRRHQLGFTASRTTMKNIDPKVAEQLVLDQLESDAAARMGPRTIRHHIAMKAGTHLTRDFVRDTMQDHQPEGFIHRDPGARQIHREQKVPIGVNERWSGDGHDKLYKIGFPIWAIVDDATGKWLGAWVVPSNRLAHVVAYLFLCTVEKLGGVPLQMTTDCGSETTQLHGLALALREIFHPDFDNSELPAHIYLRSVHNISIERSWLRLRMEVGDSAVIHFRRGEEEGIYDSQNPDHLQLCQWLWPKLLQKVISEFVDVKNAYKSRVDHTKAGPSGMSRYMAYALPERWGGRNCLLPVDINVIREIKAAMGGDENFRFPLVTAEFEQRAEAAYNDLGVHDLNFINVWHVFESLLAVLFP